MKPFLALVYNCWCKNDVKFGIKNLR